MAIGVLIAGLAVNAWLLIIVYRQGVRKQLPWFASYVAWEFLLTFVQLAVWASSPRLYVAVYWWMETIEVALIVGAVRESFLRIFKGFTAKPGFRWLVSGVIIAVVVYSAWKAIYAPPPPNGSRLGTLVIGAEFMFRWGIAAIGFLTMVLSWLLKEPSNTHEDAVVIGFGIVSIAVVASMVIRSLFGTSYLFVSQNLPSVGYFVAAFLWIWVFSRPVEGIGFKDVGMEPEEMLKTMRGYREDVKRIRGSKG